ncbi:MAG: hypothetical protein Q3976_04705 [Corynebacterium sp.]|nr:hypothetical protein [Corynebacterium sp.]
MLLRAFAFAILALVFLLIAVWSLHLVWLLPAAVLIFRGIFLVRSDIALTLENSQEMVLG